VVTPKVRAEQAIAMVMVRMEPPMSKPSRLRDCHVPVSCGSEMRG